MTGVDRNGIRQLRRIMIHGSPARNSPYYRGIRESGKIQRQFLLLVETNSDGANPPGVQPQMNPFRLKSCPPGQPFVDSHVKKGIAGKVSVENSLCHPIKLHKKVKMSKIPLTSRAQHNIQFLNCYDANRRRAQRYLPMAGRRRAAGTCEQDVLF